MADNKKYYYLKLKDNFYDSEQMLLLESMENGYLYSNILMKMYLRSLKSNGKLMFNDRIPYNPQMLSKIVKHNVDVVEKALMVFKELDLIEILDNGAIYMLDIQNFIGQSSTEGDRKREYRNKIKEEQNMLLGQMSDKCPLEIDIDIEKDIDINNICGTKKFKKPTLEELENYKLERKSSLDVQKFYNYYEANGWKVGKNPMKDWKATFRYWERNENPKQTEEDLPSWYGKEIKKQKITTEEQEELKNMLKEFEE